MAKRVILHVLLLDLGQRPLHLVEHVDRGVAGRGPFTDEESRQLHLLRRQPEHHLVHPLRCLLQLLGLALLPSFHGSLRHSDWAVISELILDGFEVFRVFEVRLLGEQIVDFLVLLFQVFVQLFVFLELLHQKRYSALTRPPQILLRRRHPLEVIEVDLRLPDHLQASCNLIEVFLANSAEFVAACLQFELLVALLLVTAG